MARNYALIAAALAGTFTISSARADDETKISFSDAPAAVQAAITKVVGSDKVDKLTKEAEDGKTTFEAEFKADGKNKSVEINDKGEVLEEETEIDASALPSVVSEAIKAKYATGTIGEADEVKKHDKMFYEVDVKVEKAKHELKISPDGKIMKDKIEDEKD